MWFELLWLNRHCEGVKPELHGDIVCPVTPLLWKPYNNINASLQWFRFHSVNQTHSLQNPFILQLRIKKNLFFLQKAKHTIHVISIYYCTSGFISSPSGRWGSSPQSPGHLAPVSVWPHWNSPGAPGHRPQEQRGLQQSWLQGFMQNTLIFVLTGVFLNWPLTRDHFASEDPAWGKRHGCIGI